MKNIPKSWVSIALSLCLVLTPILPFAIQDVHAAPTGGGDDFDDPYVIDSCEDWVAVSSDEATYFGSIHFYELANDIDCSADANDVIWGDAVDFTGEVHGNGYSITIDIDRNADETALFAVTNNAYIYDLQVFGTVDVVGDFAAIGGLIGYVSDDTEVDQVGVEVDVTASGSDAVGGIIGYAETDVNIDFSYVNADIDGAAQVGGFIGYSNGDPNGVSVENGYSAGSVSGADKVGGLVGQVDNFLYLDNNFSVATITSAGDYYGGIVGYMNSGEFIPTLNFYGSVESGLGTDNCISLDGEGIIYIEADGFCESYDTGVDATYFFNPANEPFTVDGDDIWNDGEEYPYLYWYFSGDDYPVPYPMVDLGDFSGSGSGTELDPYVVTTCAEIIEINNSVDTLGASYLLDPAGDATELDCTANGNDIMVRTNIGPFTGSFDGDGNTVIIDVDNVLDEERHTGLFGRAYGATFTDINVAGDVAGVYKVGGLLGHGEQVTITGSRSSVTVTSVDEDNGGLVGECEFCTISESSATGSVTGDYSTGGFIGDCDECVITDSYATGTVNGGYETGGFIGRSNGIQIDSCYATGDVESDDEYVGGFIGYDSDGNEDSVIEYSYATGDVTNTAGPSTGGFIGYAEYTEIYYSYATGDVDATEASDYIGGFAGYADSAEFYEVFATGDVIGNDYIGGLVGHFTDSYLYDGYARGDVTGTYDVGGLIGHLEYEEVVNTYSTGAVVNTDDEFDIGGLICHEDEGDTDYSFWDIETSGTEDSDSDEEGKTTAEMKTLATFTTDLGEDAWDFDDIWTIDTNTVDAANDGYPYFQWQDLETGSTPADSSRSSSGSRASSNSNSTETDSSPTTSTDFSFSDTPNHWAEDFADKLKEKCDVYGYQNEVGEYLKTFGPDNAITRAELVRMLIACKQVSGLEFEQVFPDVNESDWFGIYITYAFNQGWIQGYDDGEFKPNQPITRAEAIKIILLSHYSADDIIGQDIAFSDVDVSAWYAEFVTFAEELGFVSGYTDENGDKTGEFKPGNNITRGESAKIISLVLGL